MELNTIKNSIPRIGDKAPDFEAITTQGVLRLSDYNVGSWIILFSHPADFTPVCTTELTEFAREQEYFLHNNTKLLGLSIDSIHSHVAWVHNVRANTGVTMRFPLIADIGMKVANLYGMLHPGEHTTETVRAVFFIDPNGTIRLIMYYPLNVGRSIDEIKRVLTALQTADANKCSLPVNWKKGELVIMPPPKTITDLEARDSISENKIDFYLIKKTI
jgi:peroxiredoxin (alkyl hydroperoxide reductase subunit C)